MDTLAAVCDAVAAHNSRLRKVSLLAEYLRELEDADCERAVRFLTGRPFAAADARRLSVGGSTLRAAAAGVLSWDAELLRLCYREVGDMGEAIGLLLEGRQQKGTELLSLAEAEQMFVALENCRKTAEKLAILQACFRRHRPAAVKYFVKIISGDLRIGLQEKTIEEALAQATDAALEQIRAANNSSGDLGRVAIAARHGRLHEIEATLFHPMDFMLAKPLDAVNALEDPSQWSIEDKFDGIRAQLHSQDGHTRIYTRGLKDATASFPDLVAAARSLSGSVVLDGEVLGFEDGRALPFNLFQQRLARKKVDAAMLTAIPAAFMAYDILLRNGTLLLPMPLEQRREILERTLEGCHPLLQVSRMWQAEGHEGVETLFEQARSRGNEGLVLKRHGSIYEPGRRSGEWLKLKRPYATLDVVVTAAEQGTGRRAIFLSDYTFAVRAPDGGFVNVGKAYSGLTDPEVRELTRRLRGLSTQRFGRVLLVRPEIVLEVAFDGVQQSPRHKSGYALRFPRIVRWRRDKKPEECDVLERVETLYQLRR